MLFLGHVVPRSVAVVTSCKQALHLWVPLLFPPPANMSLTSSVPQDTGGRGRLELQGAERQAGFVQSHGVLPVVEMGEKVNISVKISTLHLNWRCLADTQPHQSKIFLEINRGEMY